MTDPLHDSDGELLSAWLAGDLGDDEAAALERRMAEEPGLGERLDRIAGVVVALGGLDEVGLPAGAGERLRERLDREQDPHNSAEDAVVSLEARRARRRSRWPAVVAAAAAVVAVVAVIPALTGVLSPLGDQATDESAELAAPAEPESASGLAAPAPSAGSGEADEPLAASPGGAAGLQVAPRPDRPVVVEGAPLALAPAEVGRSDAVEEGGGAGGPAGTEAAGAPPGGPAAVDELRSRYAGLPEATGILGTPVSEAALLAEAFAADIRDAPAFPDGSSPAACLDDVLGRPEAVPVRVEAVTLGDARGVAYVLVGASPGAAQLDRVDVVVVDAGDCSVLVSGAL